MELANKKAVFLGDSITEGHGTSDPSCIYLNRLAGMARLREVVNYGIGGTRIARQRKPSNPPQFDLDFCMRCEELDADADLVVVFGGTNDFGHGDAPIGTPEDRGPETFYGACHYLMRRLTERFPGKPVVFMTPLHRADETANRIAPLSVYVDIIREVARLYSFPVLDLYGTGGIQPCIPAVRERFCPDGLHPNDAGHEIIAQRLFAFLRAY